MVEIVGIQFKNSGRVYYFAPNGIKFKVGDSAIVETVRGIEIGNVIIANREVEDEEVQYELKPIVRKASDYDLKMQKMHEAQAPESFALFKKYVSTLNLPMKPLYCEYTIDGTKIVFYYSADDRVDFRDLLKVLTPNFKLRVELRQIGPREAARIVGGLGPCGRVVCCKEVLNNFDYVTMKMAKDQNMSLNSDKISGICGKLMCCIAYEHELYVALKKELPNVGQLVKTPKCPCCKVVSVDYMKKMVACQEEQDGMPTRYKAEEVSLVTPRNPNRDDSVRVDNNDELFDEQEAIARASQPRNNENRKPMNNKRPFKQRENNQNNNKDNNSGEQKRPMNNKRPNFKKNKAENNGSVENSNNESK